jgi:hypothetical protein
MFSQTLTKRDAGCRCIHNFGAGGYGFDGAETKREGHRGTREAWSAGSSRIVRITHRHKLQTVQILYGNKKSQNTSQTDSQSVECF